MSGMPLHGVRVLEFAGLAPGPFAGMVLADWGAEVIRIDREGAESKDVLARGKKSIAVNLKSPQGLDQIKRLALTADVVIEPFRPGVMEKLGLGPDALLQLNPRLVYARMTGFGQGGDKATEAAAGHDNNYLAQSGILSMLRPDGGRPVPPINLLADFAGGGFVCAFGILMALYERKTSGKGQVVDAAMVDGAAYLSSFVFRSMHHRPGTVGTTERPSSGLLDGGAPFYDTYECKDGKFFTVGALEPQFYRNLMKVLGLQGIPQFKADGWPHMKQALSQRFREKTQAEWTVLFHGSNSCAFPVLSYEDAVASRHNVLRGTWLQGGGSALPPPAPAPKLSRTPAVDRERPEPEVGQHTQEILAKL